jgi:hypothetical protein
MSEWSYLSVALQSVVGPWPLFGFLILYTVGRIPWTGDQPVTRLLPTHRTTQNKRTQTSMSWVTFEPTIPAFERAKTVHVLCTRWGWEWVSGPTAVPPGSTRIGGRVGPRAGLDTVAVPVVTSWFTCRTVLTLSRTAENLFCLTALSAAQIMSLYRITDE